MWWTKQNSGFKGWFHVKQSNGALRTGLVGADFTVTIRSPLDDDGYTAVVEESNKAGLYTFDINSQFLIDNGIGEYGVSVEVDSRGSSGTPNVRDAVSKVLRVTQDDFDSLTVGVDTDAIADAVWDEDLTEHTVPDSASINLIQSSYHRDSVIFVSDNGSPGTVLGVNGIETNPVDNLSDARDLADSLKIQSFKIIQGSFTLNNSFTEWSFAGSDQAELDINGQNVNASTFSNLFLKGDMSGNIKTKDCNLEDITNFLGEAKNSSLSGTISLAVGESIFDSCYSGEPKSTVPVLDAYGPNRVINFRSYSGGIQVENMVDASNAMAADFIAGEIIIDSSCTGGRIDIRGILKPIQDNSAGTNVITTGVINQELIADAVWDESISDHSTSNTFGRAVGSGVAIETLVSGGTILAIETGLTQSDDFWNGHQVIVEDASNGEKIVRNISTYTQSNGTITFDSALPFTPAANDPVIIITRDSVSDSDISDAVWDAQLSDYTTSGTFGEWVGKKVLTVAKFLGLK